MDTLTASVLTAVLVALCILVHYEALKAINAGVRRWQRHRLSMLGAMYGLFVAHAIEIWIFAAGYRAAAWLDLGAIAPEPGGWLDLAYFSAMVYTTVGFGDLLPVGSLRTLVMAEALAGLSLITWSASFAFLEMQRLWR